MQFRSGAQGAAAQTATKLARSAISCLLSHTYKARLRARVHPENSLYALPGGARRRTRCILCTRSTRACAKCSHSARASTTSSHRSCAPRRRARVGRERRPITIATPPSGSADGFRRGAAGESAGEQHACGARQRGIEPETRHAQAAAITLCGSKMVHSSRCSS